MNKPARRVLSAAGIVLVGDAVAHLVYPHGHLDVWSWPGGAAIYQKALNSIRRDFRCLVTISSLELVVGIGLLALSQRPR